ncbi:MAG: helix-turn-helix domain-containing protein [Muribaculaceae bacterium]|nr:helix-turn-helix domain-containing protein [Muribaculaceae bacterium]
MRIIDIDTTTKENPEGSRFSKDLFIYHGPWQDEEGQLFRLDTLCIYFVRSGRHMFVLNSIEYVAYAGEIIISHPNDFFSDLRFSDDFYCTCVYCALDFASEGVDPLHFQQCLRYLRDEPILHLDKEQLSLMTSYVSLMEKRNSSDTSRGYPKATELICKAYISDIFNLLLQETPIVKNPETRTRPTTIYQDFIDILASSRKKERNVKHYAEKLSITPKYLSHICKVISGKTAPEWIKEYVMNDALRYIVGTDFSIKEIAMQLGFYNFAFFCRTIKKHFGRTPLELRNQNIHGDSD